MTKKQVEERRAYFREWYSRNRERYKARYRVSTGKAEVSVYTQHGMAKTPEYRAWQRMKERCLNPKHTSYYLYGGRGITVCNQWANSFQTFYRDVGPKPGPAYSLGRAHSDDNYDPGCVSWETQEQQHCSLRTNRHYAFQGETKTIAQWARQFGLNPGTLWCRLNEGNNLLDAQARASLRMRTGRNKSPRNVLAEMFRVGSTERIASQLEFSNVRTHL